MMTFRLRATHFNPALEDLEAISQGLTIIGLQVQTFDGEVK
jgi:hypothetical protein